MNKRITKIIAGITIGILLLTSFIVFLVPLASSPQFEMKVVGDDIKGVEIGGSATYMINVKNIGNKVLKSIHIETTNVPEGWEAVLSKNLCKISPYEEENIDSLEKRLE